MKWGSIPKTFPYPNYPNNSFRIAQGESLEDVILEEGKGTLKTDTDADIPEWKISRWRHFKTGV